MLSSRPLRSIVIAVLVLLGGSAGVDAAVDTGTPLEVRPVADLRRSESSDEQWFVDKINELRVGLGLEPLTVDPILVPLARDWATHLRSQGALSHAADLSVGVPEGWSRLGENVGVGPAGQLQALFDAFVASPAHYANLIKPDYRYIGVGVVHGDDGRIWTAHRFMARASDAAGSSGSTTTAPSRPGTPPSTTAGPVATTPTTAPQRSTTVPGGTSPTSAPTTVPALDAANADPGAATPAPTNRPMVAPALVERIAADLEAAGL